MCHPSGGISHLGLRIDIGRPFRSLRPLELCTHRTKLTLRPWRLYLDVKCARIARALRTVKSSAPECIARIRRIRRNRDRL